MQLFRPPGPITIIENQNVWISANVVNVIIGLAANRDNHTGPDYPAPLDAVARPGSAAEGQMEVDDPAGNMNQSSAVDGAVQRLIGDEETGSNVPQPAHSSTASSPSPVMTLTGSAGDDGDMDWVTGKTSVEDKGTFHAPVATGNRRNLVLPTSRAISCR